MKAKKDKISNEELLELLRKDYVNIDFDPVEFVYSIFRDLVKGVIDDDDFNDYYTKCIKVLALQITNSPGIFYREGQLFCRKELILASAIFDKLEGLRFTKIMYYHCTVNC